SECQRTQSHRRRGASRMSATLVTKVTNNVKLTPAGPRIESTADLKRLANRVRIEIIKMIGAAASGHPGGSLSEVELLAALYFRVLRHDPSNPTWRERDRFILSKGHGCPALYAISPKPDILT